MLQWGSPPLLTGPLRGRRMMTWTAPEIPLCAGDHKWKSSTTDPLRAASLAMTLSSCAWLPQPATRVMPSLGSSCTAHPIGITSTAIIINTVNDHYTLMTMIRIININIMQSSTPWLLLDNHIDRVCNTHPSSLQARWVTVWLPPQRNYINVCGCKHWGHWLVNVACQYSSLHDLSNDWNTTYQGVLVGYVGKALWHLQLRPSAGGHPHAERAIPQTCVSQWGTQHPLCVERTEGVHAWRRSCSTLENFG